MGITRDKPTYSRLRGSHLVSGVNPIHRIHPHHHPLPKKRSRKNGRDFFPFSHMATGIEDLVVNSVALAFILQIDELLCSEFLGFNHSNGCKVVMVVGAMTWIRSDLLVVSKSVCFCVVGKPYDL